MVPESEHDEIKKTVKKTAIIALFVNIILSTLKYTAGILGHSHTMIADATHSLSDCITDIALLIGVRWWTQPPDDSHPYGHQKIEHIISIFIGLALGAAGIGIFFDSIQKIHSGKNTTPGFFPLFAAVISIITKELLYRWTLHEGTRIKSSAVIANAWHHRSDGFSSIPAAIAISAAIVFPGFGYLDLIGAILVCVFILTAAWKIIFQSCNELTDTGISSEQKLKLDEILQSIPEIKGYHAVRSRKSGSLNYLDLHILVDGQMTVRSGHDVSENVEIAVKEKMGEGYWDILVHIEPADGESDP
ncbi:cation diffusion facilitator family transporter [Myxococcota bacterium]|nr:cation diffusion facilitator family transporter [Myxococcota bacterium]MBU1382160.1 cation diffusion facilitator family transporter [Myxococcota bacterium]MBU1498750.1 cation diffusion facilitator family transporter [Myxococcota bacterium]